jgi:adenylate kinase
VKRRIVLIGPPASGKGTYAAKISQAFNIPAASTGSMLRSELELGSEIGNLANQYTSKGQLASDDLVLKVVARWLETQDHAFIFDGFPRTLPQAHKLEELLAARGTPLEIALLLDIPFETIKDRVIRRLVCTQCRRPFSLGKHVDSADAPCPVCGHPLIKRGDDSVEVLEQRMRVHREVTEPIIPFYRERGLLETIDASRDSEIVMVDIEIALGARA